MDYSQLNQEELQQMKQAQMGDAIILPFDAPTLWWRNGDPRIPAETSAVQHFGGWCAHNDEKFMPEWQHSNLRPEIFTNNEGEPYEVLTTRFIMFSTIGIRTRWDTDQFGKKSSRTHVLGYAGFKSGKDSPVEPWMPVVLSAGGYSGKHLELALGDWQKFTAKLRYEHAGGTPDFLFWCALGTFGQEVKRLEVGKSQKNYISPVQIAKPDDMTPERLDSLFVGYEMAERLTTLFHEAQTWLKAWDNLEERQKQFEQTPYDPQPDYIPGFDSQPAPQQYRQRPTAPQKPISDDVPF